MGWSGGAKVSCICTSPGHQTDIGLQLGKACYPCSRAGLSGLRENVFIVPQPFSLGMGGCIL